MLMKNALSIIAFFLGWFTLSSQETDGYPRMAQVDVQHYKFEITLNDKNDKIQGQTQVDVVLNESVEEFTLDLFKRDGKRGMEVSSVIHDDKNLDFNHGKERLEISLPGSLSGAQSFIINYSGIPADGLIISENKFGDRTFFGDNWPNRAHHWLPCVDHPSDKATVEFVVTAPDHYQVVSNGIQYEETNLDENTKLTHWRSGVKLPTKVMVIGVAPFAVQLAGLHNRIPIQSWVYPENKEEGFRDYALAVRVLEFFEEYVAPYPYEKLANVQSKTRYGGMENAGAIFYYEDSVTGLEKHESLIAHEIAHQWFGDSASEGDWHHIWLSEGFATYFTELFKEWAYDDEAFQEGMRKTREDVIKYRGGFKNPIVDTRVKNYNHLLNPNSYEKGAWVLHMLRKKIGDKNFKQGVRNYYETYKESNAFTDDFKKTMENVSGENLDGFFNQWVHEGQHPILKISWAQKKKRLELEVVQTQSKTKEFPLELEVITEEGKSEVLLAEIRAKKKQKIKFNISKGVKELKIDPYCWMLYERIE